MKTSYQHWYYITNVFYDHLLMSYVSLNHLLYSFWADIDWGCSSLGKMHFQCSTFLFIFIFKLLITFCLLIIILSRYWILLIGISAHTKFEKQVVISHNLLISYARYKIFKLITFSYSTWLKKGGGCKKGGLIVCTPVKLSWNSEL